MEKDYICGCGKAYGSYPAFSTHRKTKHNNTTVQGTVLPSQQKAKRGRPSCDFKKIPQMNKEDKQYFKGLNIIECGLLDLEEKYKGKILSQPSTSNDSDLSDLDSDSDDQKQRIQAITTFIKLITNHMRKQPCQSVVKFIRQLVQFGVQTSQLMSIHVYNTFCLKNLKNLKNTEMGVNFYIDICLLLSKWLCVMGHSREILKLKARATPLANNSNMSQISNMS